ncbi:hypothetical protein [Rhizorhapis sp. SPR117]|uniref:hypothetical protein n=1 Tax=Rhizorhapis sp. SPR117 TaxID=2912611 RepID=UPI001F30F5FA|nr:hypothetical protein [Rhizorhapis sp. SPR117]
MNEKYRSRGRKPDADIDRPNISTENQPEGAAGRPSDTLDREPDRDPQSGGAIPPDYNPRTMTRKGEEKDTAAGRERRNPDRR